MNICIATSEYIPEPGGIATFYHALAQLLTQAGHQVTVLTAGEEATHAEVAFNVVRLEKDVLRFSRDIKYALRGAAPSVVRHLALGLAMQAWLKTHAQRRGFDVVETEEFGGSGSFLTDPLLPPLAVTCHGSYGQLMVYQNGGQSNPKYQVLVGLETLLMGLADVVTAYSPANAHAWTGYLQREISFVTAPWLNTAQVVTPVERVRPDQGPPEGIVVGRLQNWKGTLELLAALDICRQRSVPVRVTWVGRDTSTAPDGGSMLGYIQQQFPDVWGANFKWIERLSREETRRAQAAADFAVVPSQWDTLNFTAVESMSVGTPLIISSGAGASYLVEDGESGLITPPQNAHALADAIERLAMDAPLRQRLGCAGKEVIHREFDPERVVSARIATYEAAIRRRALRRERPFLAPASGLITELIGLERRRKLASPAGRARWLAGGLKKRLLGQR